MSEKPVIKFNSGAGALLCSRCNIILYIGFDHDKPLYCKDCQRIKGFNKEKSDKVL